MSGEGALATVHGGLSFVDAVQFTGPVSHPEPNGPLVRALNVPCAPVTEGNDPLSDSMTPPLVVLKLRLLTGTGGAKKLRAKVNVQTLPGMFSAWKLLTPDQSGATVKQTIPPAECVPRNT